VAAVSSDGRLLLFLLSEMKHLQSGGKGIIIMGLAEDATLVSSIIISQANIEVTGRTGSREHTIKLSGANLQSYFGKRARGGKALPAKFKPNSLF
jgi:topoisomerase-4 subunit A